MCAHNAYSTGEHMHPSGEGGSENRKGPFRGRLANPTPLLHARRSSASELRNPRRDGCSLHLRRWKSNRPTPAKERASLGPANGLRETPLSRGKGSFPYLASSFPLSSLVRSPVQHMCLGRAFLFALCSSVESFASFSEGSSQFFFPNRARFRC